MTDSEFSALVDLESARRAFLLEQTEARLERKIRALTIRLVACSLFVGVTSAIASLLFAHWLWRLHP